ncbi:MAG: hypothetical protein ACP5Q1_07400, partial [Anaerolineae bacterium]
MEERTLVHSPERLQASPLSLARTQHSTVALSRSVIASLIVFALSFVVLFAGPALALRLMAAAVEDPMGSAIGYVPDAHAAQTTTIFQQGLYPTAGYTGTYDTYIVRWNPTLNGGTEARLVIGQSRSWRSLLYFDLAPGGIPTNAVINSAELVL